MTTIAQKYIEDGRIQERAKLIKMMLKSNNTIANIAKWLGLPESEVRILSDMKLSD